jgi:3-oxoacyl-[acyl-carrier protein] reductase
VTAADPLALFRLDGRLAVVTGAGSGIGRDVVRLYAEAGARVVATDINAAALAETADAIGKAVQPIVADLTDPSAVEGLADAAEAIAPIDIWANVAGIGAARPINEIDPPFYDRVTAINQHALFWACAAAARRMIPHKRGVILNVSSNAADQPMHTLSVYAMTKAAANMLTRSLAAELGPHGIRVNAVAPGFTVTAMTAPDTMDEGEREALLARNAARSPLDMVGRPDDIAHALLYLASDAARFVTGQILRVNGGVSMP